MKTEANPLKSDPCSLVDRCIEHLQKCQNAAKAMPLKTETLSTLRFNGQELPPSLKRYLAFDATFDALFSEWSEFERFVPMPEGKEWASVTPEAEIIRWIELLTQKPAKKLRLLDSASQPVAHVLDYARVNLTGKLYCLPGMSDQSHFIYVGKADQSGEYPVLAFEMQGDLEDDTPNAFWGELRIWIKYPNFGAFLYDQLFDADYEPEEFSEQTRQICARNPELAGK
ncbi:MAG: hypothetical protein K2W95_20230 [Candidatus Obscuribacterales bacterium]|nr:hypothetical protein [Candidatus Obscuribacterales bacterium]